MNVRHAALLLGLAAATLGGLHALAQDVANFPSRNVHIIVPNAAGGGIDYLARLVGGRLSDRLGKPVVVENRPGANATLATGQLMKSAPDGHTLMMGSIGMMTVNPAVVANLPYDTRRDFAPISIIASFPLILTVNAAAPVRSVQELIAYSRANPDKANAAASGPIFQVVQKMFEQRTGATFQYITYRSNSESMLALIRGDALMSLSDSGPAAGPLQDGRVRAIAVTSPQRLPQYPDVPTMAEAGIKGMVVEFWSGLVAPAKTPPAIVTKLQDEVMAIVKMPDVQARVRDLGLIADGRSGAAFREWMAADIPKYQAVAKAAGIKFD